MPFVLVDVRSAEEVSDRPLGSLLGSSRATAVHLPGVCQLQPCERTLCLHALPLAEAELPMALRPPGTAWEQRFGRPLPGARQTLVFLSGNGQAAVRCASIAANLGFLRCSVLEGGLDVLGGGGASRAPRFVYISR